MSNRSANAMWLCWLNIDRTLLLVLNGHLLGLCARQLAVLIHFSNDY